MNLKVLLTLVLILTLLIIIPKTLVLYKKFSSMQKAISTQQQVVNNIVTQIKAKEQNIKALQIKLEKLRQGDTFNEFGIAYAEYNNGIEQHKKMVETYNIENQKLIELNKKFEDEIKNNKFLKKLKKQKK